MPCFLMDRRHTKIVVDLYTPGECGMPELSKNTQENSIDVDITCHSLLKH